MISHVKGTFSQLGVLTKRHLKVFFNNKMRVFYTLLVPIIIFAVYVLFLRSLELSSIESFINEKFSAYPDVISNQMLLTYITSGVDSWMLSGIVSLSTLTVSLQTNNIFVEDKENGINRDFVSSPIDEGVLIGSYFLYNIIVTFSTCLFVALLTLIYLAAKGEFFLSFVDFLMIVGSVFIATITSTLVTIFVCLFIKKESTLSSIIAVGATAAGFLIGAYMPISMLPTWVQNLCSFIPGTYSTSILRNAYSSTILVNIEQSFNGLSISQETVQEFINELRFGFGYDVSFFGNSLNVNAQLLIVLGVIVFFTTLNIFFGKEMTKITDGVAKIRKSTKKFNKRN